MDLSLGTPNAEGADNYTLGFNNKGPQLWLGAFIA